jgi:hypothetical protein
VYTTFLRGQGVPEKNILSQHDFRKAIALAWINPEQHYQTRNVRKPATGSTPASAQAMMGSDKKDRSMRRKTKKTRTKQFTDKLVALNGRLSCTWLNTALNHLPVPGGAKLRCSMHCWLGIETQKDLSKCEACNVCLCIKCYKCFHMAPDLAGMKDELREFYENKENEKKTAMDCWNKIESTTTPKKKGNSEARKSGINTRRKRKAPGEGAFNMEAV